MIQGPVSPWVDRLELGEGARWVDGRVVLVDLFTVPVDVPGFPAAAFRDEGER
jgi:hypothetical protein